MRSFSAADVLRTLAALKFALSSTMRVVSSEMALSQPADHAGDRDRARRVGDHQVGRRERRTPHRSARRCVRLRAPDAPKIVSPCSLSRSKACIGCASSAMM